VSHGILQTDPRNLAKFAVENCGPYSLVVTVGPRTAARPVTMWLHHDQWLCGRAVGRGANASSKFKQAENKIISLSKNPKM